MAHNANVNLTQTPRNGLHLTAPTHHNHVQRQRQNPLGTHSSHQSDPILSKVMSLRTSSKMKFLTADEKGKKVATCAQFIRDLSNPQINNSFFVGSFRNSFGNAALRQLCEDVSFSINGTRNAEAGERLLTDNFRIIFRIRDAEGKTPVDSYYDSLLKDAETWRAQAHLDSLHATLISYQTAFKKTQQSSRELTDPQLFTEASELKGQAIQEFKELPPKAKGLLCQKIWALDGEQKIHDYGYNASLQDILKLLSHKGTSPIDDCTKALELEKNQTVPYVPVFKSTEVILPDDSPETIGDIIRLHELESFKPLLMDPSRNNALLIERFNKLPPEFRDFLSTIVWLSDYKFKDKTQRENHLRGNMGILLNIRNKSGANVIDQLVSHYRGKIAAHRVEKEIGSFIQSCPNKDANFIRNRFNALSDTAKEGLRYKIWYNHGGKDNPQFGGWNYGENKIQSDPLCLFRGSPLSIATSYYVELQNKWKNGDQELLNELDRVKTLPKEPVDVSTKPLETESGLISHLPEDLRVAYVTAEFTGVANIGGLGPALDGMVRGFSPEKARVIMPLYRNGPISDQLISQMEETDHQIFVEGRKIRIFKAKVNGVRCYFIDAPDLFWIPKKSDGTSGNFYEGDYHHNKRRWAVFQRAAADLVYAFSKKEHPVKLVHVNDSQTALVPKFLKELHPDEWARGETPATVFTFHNNREPNTYYSDTDHILGSLGLPKRPMNSFIEGMNESEVTTTVSKTYGKEAQLQNPDFGNNMHDFVKKTALDKRLYGIVNGNSNGWNPARDVQLQNWVSALNETKGQKVDLRYGPHLSDQELTEKKKRIQRELCAYLKQLDPQNPAYANLDPEKPIVMYLGRYDIGQKGIDKLPLIMEETLKNGGQFICIGLEPDHEAAMVLEKMQHRAKELGNTGALVLIDKKDNGRFVYQGVFGSLLRAACTLPIFPSIYEPCGLVQGEFNRFGKKVIATKTGGFPDTLKTEGKDANGYLFERRDVWYSKEQEDEIKKTLKTALEDAKRDQQALYHGQPSEVKPQIDQMRTIMTNAISSTWETTPDDSLSAIRLLELVYAKAFQTLRNRGQIIADLKTVTV